MEKFDPRGLFGGDGHIYVRVGYPNFSDEWDHPSLSLMNFSDEWGGGGGGGHFFYSPGGGGRCGSGEGEAKASISFFLSFFAFGWLMAYIPVAPDSFGATSCPHSIVINIILN